MSDSTINKLRQLTFEILDDITHGRESDLDFIREILQEIYEMSNEAELELSRWKRAVSISSITPKLQYSNEEELFLNRYKAYQQPILLGEFVKLIPEMNLTELFQWLRDNKYLGDIGATYNSPTDKACTLLIAKENIKISHDNTVSITRTVMITPEGVITILSDIAQSLKAKK
jgi:phage antirepressor YoqD-like protein